MDKIKITKAEFEEIYDMESDENQEPEPTPETKKTTVTDFEKYTLEVDEEEFAST